MLIINKEKLTADLRDLLAKNKKTANKSRSESTFPARNAQKSNLAEILIFELIAWIENFSSVDLARDLPQIIASMPTKQVFCTTPLEPKTPTDNNQEVIAFWQKVFSSRGIGLIEASSTAKIHQQLEYYFDLSGLKTNGALIQHLKKIKQQITPRFAAEALTNWSFEQARKIKEEAVALEPNCGLVVDLQRNMTLIGYDATTQENASIEEVCAAVKQFCTDASTVYDKEQLQTAMATVGGQTMATCVNALIEGTITSTATGQPLTPSPATSQAMSWRLDENGLASCDIDISYACLSQAISNAEWHSTTPPL